jgi:hypothetical protein
VTAPPGSGSIDLEARRTRNRKRLTTITTTYNRAGTYKTMDSYSLGHGLDWLDALRLQLGPI